MIRWLEKDASERFIDVISSINTFSQNIYATDLVLANYDGRPGVFTSLEETWDALAEVRKDIDHLDGEAKEYMNGIAGGVEMILRVMQGDQVSYAEQIAAMEEIESREITDEEIGALSEILGRQLTDMGYRQNTTAEKVMAFLGDYTLQPEEVVPTVFSFLERSRERSKEIIFDIPAESEIADVKGVRNVVYNGNSAYLGDFKGKLSFNIDRPWSLPTFANVLCHEGYPGHHAFYGRWDTLYREGKLPAEAAFYIKNTPTNCLFEGVPESALHFLGWDDFSEDTPEVTDKEKQIFFAGRRVLDLQRMYQQNSCHRVNIDGASKDEAVNDMMASGLFQLREAESAYRFFTDATRRTYYNSYFYGRWMIYNAYRQFPKERRAEFFSLTYDRPHTNKTYIKAVEEAIGHRWKPFETEGMI